MFQSRRFRWPIAWSKSPAKLDGFGLLAPRGEGLRTLGSIWNSFLFAGRAPEGWVWLTGFIGGATAAEAVKLGDEELIHSSQRSEQSSGRQQEGLAACPSRDMSGRFHNTR